MRRFLHFMSAILLALSLIGCRSSERVMAENHEYKITAIEKNGCITLCALDKKTSQTKELLKTNPDSRMFASLDYEYVSKVHKDSLVHLPTNAGIMGLTSEVGYLVMQSYEYYNKGGRFNVIDVYDYGGTTLDFSNER